MFRSPRVTGRISCLPRLCRPKLVSPEEERRKGGEVGAGRRGQGLMENPIPRPDLIVGFYCVRNGYCDHGRPHQSNRSSAPRAWEEEVGKCGHGRAKGMDEVGHSHAPRVDPSMDRCGPGPCPQHHRPCRDHHEMRRSPVHHSRQRLVAMVTTEFAA